jgi:hypothetical protein
MIVKRQQSRGSVHVPNAGPRPNQAGYIGKRLVEKCRSTDIVACALDHLVPLVQP